MMSYHSPELMEHIPGVPPLALRALSVEDAAAAAHCASDALRLALPLHLDPCSSSPACYLERVHGHMLPPYARFTCFPFHGALGVCDYSFEPAFIRKRNERERHRVRCVNEGYARLREHLPHEFDDKRLSKVETLRAAIEYIKHLQSLLDLSHVDVTQTFGDARSWRRGQTVTVMENPKHDSATVETMLVFTHTPSEFTSDTNEH